MVYKMEIDILGSRWVLRTCASAAEAGSSHIQLVVEKAKVVSTFKALHALKRQLGFHVSKNDINLHPSSSSLQSAMKCMVLQMLKEQGWCSLHQDMLLSMSLSSKACTLPIINVCP